MADRPRALLVTPASPVPPTSGGAQRTALLYDALSETHRVDTFLLGLPGDADRAILAERYRLVGCFVERRWFYRAWSRAIGLLCPEWRAAMADRHKRAAVERVLASSRYNIVVLRYSATACQLLGLRDRHPGVKILVDIDDALSQLVARPDGSPVRRVVMAACARRIASRERTALRDVDGLWVAGAVPALIDGGPPVVHLPNIAFYQSSAFVEGDAGFGDPTIFMGVAQFSYQPNQEGFDWFLSDVWPRIRAQMPLATLRLIGRFPAKAVAERWSMIPGVKMIGIIDDLELEYRTAGIAVAPIRRGGGTKIKVIEAMTMGLPCICTSYAATDLKVLTSLVIADDAISFARQCLDLATNDARRRDIIRAGLRQTAEHLSPVNFRNGVQNLIMRQ